MKSITFTTTCYEKSYKEVLSNNYIYNKMIKNHSFDFQTKRLLINNVKNHKKAFQLTIDLLNKKILSDVCFVKDTANDVLNFFHLNKKSFKSLQKGITDDMIFYNSIAPLTAIYLCETDYLLYMTEDVSIEEKSDWIDKAISMLNDKYKVANLVWNNKYDEAKKESYHEDANFFFAKQGFSDQMFLIKTSDFKNKIYNNIREDSSHFPWGDIFEKRVFSHMKNNKWERIIYKHHSYSHKSF